MRKKKQLDVSSVGEEPKHALSFLGRAEIGSEKEKEANTAEKTNSIIKPEVMQISFLRWPLLPKWLPKKKHGIV